MTYIWELLLKMQQKKENADSLIFKPAEEYSPYMELAFVDLNKTQVEEGEIIELNPYYRYHEIFKNLFLKDNKGEEELREVLFDILLHHLFQIDKYMGMNRIEFYKKFIQQDVQDGQWGQQVKELWKGLEEQEQAEMAMALLKLHQLGQSTALMREIAKKIFPNCYLYHHSYQKNEILLYAGSEKNKKNAVKVQLLERLFLPLDYSMQVYWKNHFGIIDIDETMYLDQIELY